MLWSYGQFSDTKKNINDSLLYYHFKGAITVVCNRHLFLECQLKALKYFVFKDFIYIIDIYV